MPGRYCHHCGSEVGLDAKFCAHCGTSVNDGQKQEQVTPSRAAATAEPSKPARKKGVVIAADISVGVGFILNLLSPPLFLLYVPLYLAGFILAIIGIAQGRVGRGILILVASIVFPFLGMGYSCYRLGGSLGESASEKYGLLQNISFEDINAYSQRNYMYFEGKVRNNNSVAVSFVKVEVTWLDGGGRVLDTDWTYAVGSTALQPGHAKSFKTMTAADTRMRNYRYRVIDD